MKYSIILASSFLIIGCSTTKPHIQTNYMPDRPDLPRAAFCDPTKPQCIERAAACVDEKNLRALYERDVILQGHITSLEALIVDLEKGRVEF